MPNAPNWSEPQHITEPLARIAQDCPLPTPSLLLSKARDAAEPLLELPPPRIDVPAEDLPQQIVEAFVKRVPQVAPAPAEIKPNLGGCDPEYWEPVPAKSTRRGEDEFVPVNELLPNVMVVEPPLSPQQYAAPVDVTTHV